MSVSDTAPDADALRSRFASMPASLAVACARIAGVLHADPRFVALLLAGSGIADAFDAHSDLDLVVVCRDEDYADLLPARPAIAARLGRLLAAFTGEHVGEPRLLICLYAEPLLHVDLKFVTPAMLSPRVEEPVVLWSRCAEVARQLATAEARWPNQAPEWFEERFWIWLHYGAAKLRRGELFETLAMLAYLREQVLGPLIARARGRDQRGLRRIDLVEDDWSQALRATLAGAERIELAAALAAAAQLYRQLRATAAAPQNVDAEREQLVLAYLQGDGATTPA